MPCLCHFYVTASYATEGILKPLALVLLHACHSCLGYITLSICKCLLTWVRKWKTEKKLRRKNWKQVEKNQPLFPLLLPVGLKHGSFAFSPLSLLLAYWTWTAFFSFLCIFVLFLVWKSLILILMLSLLPMIQHAPQNKTHCSKNRPSCAKTKKKKSNKKKKKGSK